MNSIHTWHGRWRTCETIAWATLSGAKLDISTPFLAHVLLPTNFWLPKVGSSPPKKTTGISPTYSSCLLEEAQLLILFSSIPKMNEWPKKKKTALSKFSTQTLRKRRIFLEDSNTVFDSLAHNLLWIVWGCLICRDMEPIHAVCT